MIFRKNQLLILIVFVLCSCGGDSSTNPNPNQPTKVMDVTQSPEKLAGNKEKGRDSWQKPSLVLDRMGNLEGQLIADIGAYYGYFTFVLANRGAKVIAVDIDNEMLRFIRETAAKESNPAFKENIDYRLVKADDPGLKDEEVDQVLLVNMMGYLENRVDYFLKLKNGLKSGGHFNIVDFKMKRLPANFDIPKSDRVYLDLIEESLYEIGLTNILVDDTSLDYQYIITATKP